MTLYTDEGSWAFDKPVPKYKSVAGGGGSLGDTMAPMPEVIEKVTVENGAEVAAVCLSVRSAQYAQEQSRAVNIYLSWSDSNQRALRALIKQSENTQREIREQSEYENQGHTVGALITASCCQAQVQSLKVQILVKGLGVTLKSHGPWPPPPLHP